MAVAEELAERIQGLHDIPANVRETCERLLVDVAGLCILARRRDYVKAALAGFGEAGPATAIGHPRRASAACAAFVNGTAAHGEDYDDTFEGGPVHAGAVVVPAVLAAAELEGANGSSVLRGMAVGVEILCRLSLVVPKAVHASGFHPTAVFGAPAAAAAVASTLRLEMNELVDALGISGSMAGGIIEYLAEGTWTKRLHPGWAAQSGLRAALLGRAGFRGPRTVFEGTHGLFHGFARTREGNYGALLDGFGEKWVTTTLAFKPYPCGTMIQPYIDCARRLRERVSPGDIDEIVADVGEGTVHRLWEPLADKQRPPNGYAAKFSTPYCIAAGLLRGHVGFDAFSDDAANDPDVRGLAAKVRYRIDPANPYPREFTGHLRARLRDGSVVEERQPHLRGGAREPLTRADIEEKFRSNARAGGFDGEKAAAALEALRALFDGAVNLEALRG
ncbi:MAG: MmgE/PrpD family protein [Deltaproteobacteria bacterium]|nr:MAG: MmgE/PrpD family protein [Deltaproteobacteria bacterium]